MNEPDFLFLQDMLYRRSGLALGREKLYLIESRLGTLCRKHKIESLAALIQRLRTGREPALEIQVIEAMTTNETLFFRDNTPFELMRRVVLPAAMARNARTRSLKIWCAAVSSGQEAYSIAMILKDMARELAGWRIDLIGTDISEDILEKARAATYSQFEIQRGLPVHKLIEAFTQVGEQWQVKEELRRMVRFEQFNLLDNMARFGTCDVIFCRNVMIYFDLPTKVRTLQALSERLHPQGALFLGAAETVIGISDRFIPDRDNRGLYRLAQPGEDTAPLRVITPRPSAPAVAERPPFLRRVT